MAARDRTRLLALASAALVAPACALILGAEELPAGTGGASSSASSGGGGTTSSASASTSASSASASSSSTSTSSSSTSSSGGLTCAQMLDDCTGCANCMKKSACITQNSKCGAGTQCNSYAACLFACPMDAGLDPHGPCEEGCTQQADPAFTALQSCICMGCPDHCAQFCAQ